MNQSYKGVKIFFLSAAMIVLFLSIHTVCFGIVITEVNYKDGKAVGAQTYDGQGQSMPTQGHIDPNTGQYVPGPEYKAAMEADKAKAAGKAVAPKAAAPAAFSPGIFQKHVRSESRSEYEDMENYRVRMWHEIWSGPGSSPR